jgi:metallophosphoesterase superfamily enzyme
VTRRIVIKSGYRLSKDGRRLVVCDKHLNVSLRLKQRGSKKTRAGKRALASLQRP